MNTATCPHCETILEADPGVVTVCGVCGQEFTPAAEPAPPSISRPAAKPDAPRRSWRWVGWISLVLLAVVPVALIVAAFVHASKQSRPEAIIEALTFLFSGAVGAVVMFCVVVWVVLWITFPVFVYVFLRRILRAIEANTAAKQPASRP